MSHHHQSQNEDKQGLSLIAASEPRKPYRETGDVVVGVRRLIAAVGKRVATEDPEDLEHLLALQAELDEAFRIAVAGLRASEYSDGAIGKVCGGITKQAVQQRWPRNSDTPTKEQA